MLCAMSDSRDERGSVCEREMRVTLASPSSPAASRVASVSDTRIRRRKSTTTPTATTPTCVGAMFIECFCLRVCMCHTACVCLVCPAACQSCDRCVCLLPSFLIACCRHRCCCYRCCCCCCGRKSLQTHALASEGACVRAANLDLQANARSTKAASDQRMHREASRAERIDPRFLG